MTYNNAVKHIRSLPERSGGFEQIRAVLDALGSPQKQLRSIRIGGDAGKTSCSQMLLSILAESNHRVGYYCLHTSGELRENIKIGERCIPHAEFADIAKKVLDTAVELDSDKYISAGDVTFIIALLYFASNGCDSVIIERRPSDGSAPLIESSEISVITSIYDGISPDAIEELIPRGTKETVTCIQHKQTYGEISKACAEAGCRLSLPLYADLEIKKISLYNTRFTYRGSEYSLGAFSPCQLLNAITVIEAAHALARLGMSIPESAIASGLSNAHLPLMCQVLAIEPTIIVARVESDRQLEALIASLAQVCDLVHHKIDVFVSPENAGLTADLSSRLANCSIESDQPKVIDKSDLHEFNACLSSAIAPMIKGEDTKYAALFIGNSEYVSILASQIKKILGSFI